MNSFYEENDYDGEEVNSDVQGLAEDVREEAREIKKQVEKFGYKPEEALIVTIDGKGQIFSQKKL